MAVSKDTVTYAPRVLHFSAFHFVLLILHTTSSFVIGDSDFEITEPINVINSADIRLFTTNDEITLETDDRVQLIFTPTNTLIIGGLESAGEYIRVNAIVNIIDTDCKSFNHSLYIAISNVCV